jgi:hypothetical protein
MNERKCALKHLEILEPNDVVIFDRGYFSYLLLHEFHKKGVHAALFGRVSKILLNTLPRFRVGTSKIKKLTFYAV